MWSYIATFGAGILVGKYGEDVLCYLGTRWKIVDETPDETTQIDSRLHAFQKWINQRCGRSISIEQLQKIRVLNIDNNNLTVIPCEIGALEQLEELDLQGNHLTSLPEEIGELINLRRLELSRNKLTSLPASMAQLTKLTDVNIRYNKLTSEGIPVELHDAPYLREMIMSSRPTTISWM